jgi:hypothetical protein
MKINLFIFLSFVGIISFGQNPPPHYSQYTVYQNEFLSERYLTDYVGSELNRIFYLGYGVDFVELDKSPQGQTIRAEEFYYEYGTMMKEPRRSYYRTFDSLGFLVEEKWLQAIYPYRKYNEPTRYCFQPESISIVKLNKGQHTKSIQNEEIGFITIQNDILQDVTFYDWDWKTGGRKRKEIANVELLKYPKEIIDEAYSAKRILEYNSKNLLTKVWSIDKYTGKKSLLLSINKYDTRIECLLYPHGSDPSFISHKKVFHLNSNGKLIKEQYLKRSHPSSPLKIERQVMYTFQGDRILTLKEQVYDRMEKKLIDQKLIKFSYEIN